MSSALTPLLRASNAPSVSSRKAATLIFGPILLVGVLALAASTRASEYMAIVGFAGSEEYLAAGTTAMPSKSTQILRSEVREYRSEFKLLHPLEGHQLEAKQPMTAEDIDDKAVIWASKHPEEHKKIMYAFIFGSLIGLLGLVMVLVSELKSVLVTRELDREYFSEAPKTYDLEVEELRWGRGFASTARLWFSLGGLFIMIVGSICILFPLCDVLADFGLPGAVDDDDCVTTVVLVSFVGSFALAGIVVSIVWSCTRPWAALVLAGVSIFAQVACALGSPLLLLAWAIFSAALLWYYFAQMPEGQEGYRPAPHLRKAAPPTASQHVHPSAEVRGGQPPRGGPSLPGGPGGQPTAAAAEPSNFYV